MKRKKSIEKNLSLFLIINLIVAIFAFSFSLSFVSGINVYAFKNPNGGIPKQFTADSYEDAKKRADAEGYTIPIDPNKYQASSTTTIPTSVASAATAAAKHDITTLTGSKVADDLKQLSGVPQNLDVNKLRGVQFNDKTAIDQINKVVDAPFGTSYNKIESIGDQTFAIGTDSAGNKVASNALTSDQLKKLGDNGISLNQAPASTGTFIGDYLYKNGFGLSGSNLIGEFASGVGWAATVVGVIQLIGNLMGADQKKTNAVSIAVGAGIISAKGAYGLLKDGGFLAGKVSNPGLWSIGIGVGVGIAIFLLTYKTSSTKTVTFQCLPWDAPTGGSKCELCNKDLSKPCSEYRCKSLGQGCGIINKGTAEESCVWISEKDVARPIIEVWDAALLQGYKYNKNAIQPPDRGAQIENTKSTTKCVKPFTPLRFGITANKPVQCKVDYNRPGVGKAGYDAMQFFMGGSNLYRYNHTEILSLPGPNAVVNGSPVIPDEGNYELYVKCQDANGRTNEESFVFKFCVEKGPDTTQPLIVTTSLLNNMPVAFNQTSLPLNIYVNEPSECKWSRNDIEYKDMENKMDCSTSVFEMNAQLLYQCSTTLTGLKSEQANNFYFRCKDQPIGIPESDRNVNQESYKFTVIGTRPLDILSVGPNGTIKDSTNVVAVKLKVETANGFEEGNASCYYSSTGNENDYIKFFKTDSYLHEQDLNLPAGDYKYYIKCLDLGGNTDRNITQFRVETDTSPPLVVRVFHEADKLKLITDEEASCGFSQKDCNFDINESIKFRATIDGLEHVADWSTDKTYYIKCKDQYNNKPQGKDSCSIIVKPFEFFKSENKSSVGNLELG